MPALQDVKHIWAMQIGQAINLEFLDEEQRECEIAVSTYCETHILNSMLMTLIIMLNPPSIN